MIRKPLTIVVAVSENGVIGRNGGLPWRIPEDMAHFRDVTMGHAVIMGRRTWESLPGPLVGRVSLVLSRRHNFLRSGAVTGKGLGDLVEFARGIVEDPAPCVIGGAEVFREALPLATRIEYTEVHETVDGDVFFPAWDRQGWAETAARRSACGRCTFRTWERLPE